MYSHPEQAFERTLVTFTSQLNGRLKISFIRHTVYNDVSATLWFFMVHLYDTCRTMFATRCVKGPLRHVAFVYLFISVISEVFIKLKLHPSNSVAKKIRKYEFKQGFRKGLLVDFTR